MTEFGVVTDPTYGSDKRSWLLSLHGTEPGATPSVTLDAAKFKDIAKDGYVPSGTVLALDTTTSLAIPYNPTATGDAKKAAGLLFGALPIRAGVARVGGARLIHGFVSAKKLPIKDGPGALDDAAKTALTHIVFL